MSQQNLTVGLVWHSISSDNLGVGALTLSQMALITRAAKTRGRGVDFIVIGTKGGTPYPISEFSLKYASEFAMRAFKSGDLSAIKAFTQCDVLFDIGEGDSFADIYGTGRLTKLVATKMLARLAGKPLVLSPQTIGPFQSSKGRILGKIGMKCADRVYARDHMSSTYVKELGFEHKLAEVIDVAFALPFEQQSNSSGKTKVGINVSGLMMSDGPQFKLTVDYPSLIRQAIQTFPVYRTLRSTSCPMSYAMSTRLRMIGGHVRSWQKSFRKWFLPRASAHQARPRVI